VLVLVLVLVYLPESEPRELYRFRGSDLRSGSETEGFAMDALFNRSTIDRPWLERYKFLQQRNDLLPFWYGSEWVDLPVEEGVGGRISINIGDDFWLHDLHFQGQAPILEDEQDILPQIIVPGLEIRMRIDGNLAWGSWIDNTAVTIPRMEVINDFGEGWILERGSFVEIEWRRLYAIPAEDHVEERGQWVLHGQKLAPHGATRLRDGWRNQTMQDWCTEAVLSPYRYGMRASLGENFGDALAHVNMQLKTRDRDFILERIGWAQYATTAGMTNFGSPYIGTGTPLAVTLQVQDIPWHNPQPQGISSRCFCKLGVGALPDSSRELRIPRVIAANSLIEMEVGFDQFATTERFRESYGDYFVYIAGHEIIGDNRGKLKRG